MEEVAEEEKKAEEEEGVEEEEKEKGRRRRRKTRRRWRRRRKRLGIMAAPLQSQSWRRRAHPTRLCVYSISFLVLALVLASRLPRGYPPALLSTFTLYICLIPLSLLYTVSAVDVFKIYTELRIGRMGVFEALTEASIRPLHYGCIPSQDMSG